MNDATPVETAREFLVPKGTDVEESGQGKAIHLGRLAGKPVLLVFEIDEAIEQESLHVSVWGSPDGANWGAQALFWFPQKYYVGATLAALNLALRPDLQYLQVRWEVNRWGRGNPRPQFRFSVELQEASR